MRVCRIKASKKIIEVQSGGETQAHLDTLIQNAVNAGYNPSDIEALYMSDAEYQQAQALDPEYQALQSAMQANRQKLSDSKTGMKNQTGWATWTADQAEAWINTNVTDLAGAKTALKAMARAIIFLRDYSQITQ